MSCRQSAFPDSAQPPAACRASGLSVIAAAACVACGEQPARNDGSVAEAPAAVAATAPRRPRDCG